MRSRSRYITASALLTAMGLILGYIESFIVLPVRVPGVRIGLANLVGVVALYLMGPLYALTISVVRVILSAILFSGFTGFIYSISGAIVSFIVMCLLKKYDFSVYSVCTGGAVSHNIAQIFIARFVVGSGYVFWYVPVLVIAGVAAGTVTGLLCDIIIKRLYNMFYERIDP